MNSVWRLAREGLHYVGERRDVTWASLEEIDSYREDAENPECPDIVLDTPRARERRRVLKTLPLAEIKKRMFGGVACYSRDDLTKDPDCDILQQIVLAGDCRAGSARWQGAAVKEEQTGRIAMAMESWAFVARAELSLGNLDAARAAYSRAIAFSMRFSRPSFQMVNLISVRSDFMIVLRGDAFGHRGYSRRGRSDA